REVPFEIGKITEAIRKSVAVTKEADDAEAVRLARLVADRLDAEASGQVPHVEAIQDLVERVLMEEGLPATAKAYILYRAERTRIRERNTRLMKVYEDITWRDASESDA